MSARKPLAWAAPLAAVIPALAAAPVQAQAAELAAGVQSQLLAGLGTYAALAVVVTGYFYLTNRGSLQVVIPVILGIVMLSSIGAITSAAQGADSAALGRLFLAWLRAATYTVAAAALAVVGYSYWFGDGSSKLLVPLVTGLFIVLSAEWLVEQMGL